MVQMFGTLIVAALLLLIPTSVAAQFEYDSKQPFDTICEQLTPRNDADVHGCHFTGPRGGTLSFILVNPKTAKPPFAGVILQHGGGKSMWNYLSEALILAQVGVVSVIPDAPARGEGKKSEINTMKLKVAEDFQAEIVITERRGLEAYRLCWPQLRRDGGRRVGRYRATDHRLRASRIVAVRGSPYPRESEPILAGDAPKYVCGRVRAYT